MFNKISRLRISYVVLGGSVWMGPEGGAGWLTSQKPLKNRGMWHYTREHSTSQSVRIISLMPLHSNCLFTRLESPARYQRCFWQPSFCRKRNLWSLFVMEKLRRGLSALLAWSKGKVEPNPFLSSKFLYTFPFLQESNAERHHPISPSKIKASSI